MEVTKINQGPESPADLQWSQGAKNPRKENETSEETLIGLGLLSSDTTDQVIESGTEPPNGEICIEQNKEISSHLDKFKGTKWKRLKEILKWCLEIIKSNGNIYEKCTSNPFVVVIINIHHPKGIFEEEESFKLIDKLTGLITALVGRRISPKFNDFKYDEGFVIITCHDIDTVVWLKKCVTVEITRAFGRELKAISECDFSNFTKVSAFLPGARKNDSQMRRILMGQNLSLQKTMMRIFRSRIEKYGSGINVLFEIDERAFEELNKLSMKPYFGLSRAEFHVCSSFDEWKSHLISSYPRTTLASKFSCPNFPQRVHDLKKKMESSKQKETSSQRKIKPFDKRKIVTSKKSDTRKTTRRRRKRKPPEKKNQNTNRIKESKDSQQKHSGSIVKRSGSLYPKQARRHQNRSDRIENKSRDHSKSRRPRNSSFSDRSRRFPDNARNLKPRVLEGPNPWITSNQLPSRMGTSNQPQAHDFALPQLSQISQLLNQLQTNHLLSSNDTDYYQSLLSDHPTSSMKRVPQTFNYNIDQVETSSRFFSRDGIMFQSPSSNRSVSPKVSQISQFVQDFQNHSPAKDHISNFSQIQKSHSHPFRDERYPSSSFQEKIPEKSSRYSRAETSRVQSTYSAQSSRGKFLNQSLPNRNTWTTDVWNFSTPSDEIQNFNTPNNPTRDNTSYYNSYTYRDSSRKRIPFNDRDKNKKPRYDFESHSRFDPPSQF